MGRLKKGHNWKARLQVTVAKSGTPPQPEMKSEAVVVERDEMETSYKSSADDSNHFVIPRKKENSKKLKNKELVLQQPRKKLTKKQRKKYERIVASKKKKSKRAEILQALSECAVSANELALMSSTSRLGQTDKKRKLSETGLEAESITGGVEMISSIRKGRKRAKKLKQLRKRAEDKPSPVKKIEESLSEEEQEDKESNLFEEGSNEGEDDDIDSSENEEGQVESLESTSEKDQGKEENENCSKLPEQLHNCKNSIPSTNLSEAFCKGNINTNKPVTLPKEREPAVFMEVSRDPEIQAARLQLPILAEEQIVMEAIKENQVVIICGETGSGKTTQVPQFLYEGGYTKRGIIGITEPRRVAAISMSRRVAQEMATTSDVVSYQIRYESNTTEHTLIKFMTDGVLLKEVETDFLLTKYSVIVIDEAHERSVFSDILIGLLSRIVPLRSKQGNPLKLVIMSATLKIEDFTLNTRLFLSSPPVTKVDSRQYPVTVHFNKRTPEDYFLEAYRKVCKIHRTLPVGGILVFVTGQGEVQGLCRKLRKTFPLRSLNGSHDTNDVADDDVNLSKFPVAPVVDNRDAEDEDLGEDGLDVDDGAYDAVVDKNLPMYVLPMYSLLSTQQQSKVFKSPPDGARFCVVATNVAETSLTIPNIKYVVDTGMVKRRVYDKVTGVSSFRITWTSKASANQRAGRAGRIEAGHCYRLYSSAVFNNNFEEYSSPDIQQRPVDDLMLQMKGMNIDNVINFPFPTPPDVNALQTAESLLLDLGALEKKKTAKGTVVSMVTQLGRAMAKFPVSPRYAKMLSLAHQDGCLEFVIALVSALTVCEIFVDDVSTTEDPGDKEKAKMKLQKITQLRRKWAGQGEGQKLGDLMVYLRAVGASEYAECSEKFCSSNGLRHKAMLEIRKLRAQLTNTVNLISSGANAFVNPKMSPPNERQCTVLRQICLSGMGDHVARRIPMDELKDAKLRNGYQCTAVDEPIFIHPTSALFSVLPEFVVYQEIIETSKLFMKGVTAIESSWLPVFVPSKCNFSKPLELPPPRYDADTGLVKCHMSCSFGPKCWQIPAQEVDYPSGLDKFKWFARFLLEGKVATVLARFVPSLLGSPATMLKSWAKLQPRTEALLSELVNANADNKVTLEATWKRDENFLFGAYKQWIPQSKHGELRNVWPPLE